jgi:hypothetical protein
MNFLSKTWHRAATGLGLVGVLALCLGLNTVAQESSQDIRYQNATNLFNSDAPGDPEMACDIMKKLAQETPGNQTYQTARKSFCAQVQLILDNERHYADEGVQLAKNGKCVEARADYDKITRIGTRDPRYRQQLKVEVNACENREHSQKVARISSTSEEMLRAGLKAYFRGDLGEAEDDLTSYLSKTGDHNALAYFFRGVTRGSRYFLSGETDIKQKSNALEDFHILKERYRSFRPPLKYVSPKILELY